MNRTWHETAWTEPEPGPDLGPVQQVQVPNLGPEPNFGIASFNGMISKIKVVHRWTITKHEGTVGRWTVFEGKMSK